MTILEMWTLSFVFPTLLAAWGEMSRLRNELKMTSAISEMRLKLLRESDEFTRQLRLRIKEGHINE